jgi:hypothetical protein
MPLDKKPKFPRRTRQVADLSVWRDPAVPVVGAVRLLELTEEERALLLAVDALVIDEAGRECFRGLTISESLEFLELRRLGLANGDADFMRLIELGDRHAASQVRNLS